MKYSAKAKFETDVKYAGYLTYWEFPAVLDKVDKEIEKHKDYLKKSGVNRNASDALKIYIDEIKERCDLILRNPNKKIKLDANPRDV